MSLEAIGLVGGIVLLAGGIAVLGTLAVSSFNARRERIRQYGDADTNGEHELEQYDQYFTPIRESLRKESALYGVRSDAPTLALTLDWVHQGLQEPPPLDESLIAEPELWFGCTPDTTAAWPMVTLLKDDEAPKAARPAKPTKRPSRFDVVRELLDEVSVSSSAFAPAALAATGRRPNKRRKAHRDGPSSTLKVPSGLGNPLPPNNVRQPLRAPKAHARAGSG